MAVNALRRWAMAAPAPVFVASGGGAGTLAVELAADRRIRVVDSPRHASVLLALGRFPGDLGAALDRVHDQLPHPRAVVWWQRDDDRGMIPVALAAARLVAGAPVPAAVDAYREVLTGVSASSGDVGPNRPPNFFEGRGDHGQGGEGMMGGVPFGRPLAMTGDDRDGLTLGQYSARLGPFLVGLPPCTVITATFGGEVVQTLSLESLDPGGTPFLDPVLTLFARAQGQAVAVADLERARARHHLRRVALACRLAGLEALSSRIAALASRASGIGPSTLDHLETWMRRSGLLAAWTSVGVLAGVDLPAGPDARAAGRGVDARLDDPAYRKLGFTVVTQQSGDARARLRQRLDEARQSLELARRAEAGAVIHDPAHPIEPPAGPRDQEPGNGREQLAASLVGADWADVLTTLCSLDLPAAAPVDTGVPT